MNGTDVIYNGQSLQTENITVNNIIHDSIPRKKQNMYQLTRSNRSAITNHQYHDKQITIEGQIIGTSIADLDARIDAFKTAMTPKLNVANLDIEYSSGIRRYFATIENTMISRGDALFSVNYSLALICTFPWGRDTTEQTLVNAGAITASPTNQSVTVGGNAPEQFLKITYLLNSFSGSAFNTITFKNDATGQQMTITRTWTAADSLVINTENRSVKVNGIEVDYDGVFPVYESGAGILVVSDGFTARSASLTVKQWRLYL